MGRELKFRAWNKGNREYKYSEDFGTPILVHFFNYVEVMKKQYSQDYSNYEQYTGLKDKNGKEIYEGDIVRCKEPDGLITYLIDIEWQVMDLEVGWNIMPMYTREKGYYEIIGNIHKNPELLGECYEDSSKLST